MPRTGRHALTIAVAFEAGLGLLAVVLGLVFGQSPLQTLHIEGRALVLGLLAALPMIAAFVASTYFDVHALSRIREILDEIIVSFFARATAGELAVVSAAAGVGEELLFRGLIQGGLGRVMSTPAALVVASVIFGLAHPVTKTYAVLATVFGMYLGWLWIATDNLLAPMTAHAAYDFIALLLLVRSRRDAVVAPRPG